MKLVLTVRHNPKLAISLHSLLSRLMVGNDTSKASPIVELMIEHEGKTIYASELYVAGLFMKNTKDKIEDGIPNETLVGFDIETVRQRRIK